MYFYTLFPCAALAPQPFEGEYMRSITSLLTELFAKAFCAQNLDPRYGQVVESARPDLCQYQCNGALAAAKQARRNPREIAQAIRDRVSESEMLEDLSIAGPGFINIMVNDAFLARHMQTLTNDSRMGAPVVDSPRQALVDFGSPNVAKPMHVGHLRSSLIGDSLQRLLRFLGEQVTTDNHLGDWGTQMGMLITELQRRQPNLPYFDPSFAGPYPENPPVDLADLERMYPEASKRCKGNEHDMAEAVSATAELQAGRPGYIALWKHFYALSLTELKRDYERLGIDFDYWLGESHYRDRMERLVARLKAEGKAEQSEGAWIVPVTDPGDTREIPPLLLEKSGGGFLYGTSDLATIEERVERFNAEEILYVVDKRQALHFEQVFRAAYKTGIAPSSTVMAHVGFGTVNGPDGKPFKTREGGVMKLSDLVEQVTARASERMAEAGVAEGFSEEERSEVARKVALAALKFADLSNHRESDYVFDIDKFTRFEGKTGPYLLYSAVRIKSILRNVAERGFDASALLPPTDPERKLMLLLGNAPNSLLAAREGYQPHYLCEFAYALSQEFNRFYRDCHILSEQDAARRGSWISLVKLTLAELELFLGLLGIELPDRM